MAHYLDAGSLTCCHRAGLLFALRLPSTRQLLRIRESLQEDRAPNCRRSKDFSNRKPESPITESLEAGCALETSQSTRAVGKHLTAGLLKVLARQLQCSTLGILLFYSIFRRYRVRTPIMVSGT